MPEEIGGLLIVLAAVAFVWCAHRVSAHLARRSPDRTLRIVPPIEKKES